MKPELTPEDLAKAIQFLKDCSISEDDPIQKRVARCLYAPILDQGLIDGYKITYSLRDNKWMQIL